MKVGLLTAAIAASWLAVPSSAAAQTASSGKPTTASDKTGDAYAQFLLAHRLDDLDDEAGAIAAYKKAMELDPTAANIPGELAALYLRANRVQDAMTTAQQAVKLSPTNREGNRVLGVINAALAETNRSGDNADLAIKHLEAALAGQSGEADPNVRATLARIYVSTKRYDKAIPLLTTLVDEQAGWQEGPALLAEAYQGAGRGQEAITWFEEHAESDPRLLPALGEFYERDRRWSDAARAYGLAMQTAPRNTEIRARYASALVNAGGRDNLLKAREALDGLTSSRPGEQARILYLLSQTERRLGNSDAAEAAARKVIAQSSKSPWGYYALAEALETRRDYKGVVNELSPVVTQYLTKRDPSFDVSLLLPHLGFAYQELGQGTRRSPRSRMRTGCRRRTRTSPRISPTRT